MKLEKGIQKDLLHCLNLEFRTNTPPPHFHKNFVLENEWMTKLYSTLELLFKSMSTSERKQLQTTTLFFINVCTQVSDTLHPIYIETALLNPMNNNIRRSQGYASIW